jgi:FkbM family methyltransferase
MFVFFTFFFFLFCEEFSAYHREFRDVSFHSFGGLENQDSLLRAKKLLKSGKCEHIYLDIGSNIGIQIRKLFQPDEYSFGWNMTDIDLLYNNTLNIFQYSFGTDRHYVCAFGFEPNPAHKATLVNLENKYNSANYSTVMFTTTAAGTKNGNMTLYLSKNDKLGQSASLLKQEGWNEAEVITYDVGVIDISDFISHFVMNRAGITKASKIVVKLDVEGEEYNIIPKLIRNCHLSFVLIEWHQGDGTTSGFPAAVNWIVKKAPRCPVKLIEMDDEA